MITYLLGAYCDPAVEAARAAGERPEVEYSAFLRRNPQVRPLTYDHLEGATDGLTRRFLQRKQPHWALASLAIARRKEIGAVITSGDDIWLPLLVQARVRGIGLPSYNILHGSFFGSRKLRLLLRTFRRSSGVHFLTLSESLRSILIEDFGWPPERAHNTSYGVDLRFFAPSREPEQPPIIAAAGTANRDYRTLVDAAAPLGAPVRIAADSEWFPQALDIAAADLPANVEARSYGDYRGLRELYRRATVMVVPLYPANHACGYAVIAEAMAMGKPVITTRIRTASDFPIDGATGYYVNYGDAAALRAKLSELLDAPDRAAEMGAAARRRMEEQFSVEAYCARIERIVGLSR